MDGKQTITTLLQLGTHMRDAYTQASRSGTTDWTAFLDSAEGKQAQADISGLLSGLASEDIAAAVQELQTKRDRIRDGRSLLALSPDEYAQWHAILDVEDVLVLKEAQQLRAAGFWNWLVDTALPVLARAVPVVISLLT